MDDPCLIDMSIPPHSVSQEVFLLLHPVYPPSLCFPRLKFPETKILLFTVYTVYTIKCRFILLKHKQKVLANKAAGGKESIQLADSEEP